VMGDSTTIIRHTVHESYVHHVPNQPSGSCSIRANAIDRAGRDIPDERLLIEEHLRTVVYPLVGSVFFDEQSSTIPPRYRMISREDARDFHSESLLYDDPMAINHHVLNIVGRALRDHPGATVTLRGCNADTGAEKGNVLLSMERAQAVQLYLQSAWDIDSGRIRTEGTNLPSHPSSSATANGRAENRRVEIVCSDPSLIDLVVVGDTAREVSPAGLRFSTAATADGGVVRWRIQCKQSDVVCKVFEGTGTLPASVDWNMSDHQRSVPRFDRPLEVDLTIETASGLKRRSMIRVPILVISLSDKKRDHVADVSIFRSYLLFAEAGGVFPTATHRRTLALAKRTITPQSAVSIGGYTDTVGTAGSSVNKSAANARLIAAALNRTETAIHGIGDCILLIPHDTPEGRILCRAVEVEVRTPRH
jgi:outer membrane protein OmpA-like peptidoglycan-associated protein